MKIITSFLISFICISNQIFSADQLSSQQTSIIKIDKEQDEEKKELRQRITALNAELNLLKAQLASITANAQNNPQTCRAAKTFPYYWLNALVEENNKPSGQSKKL